MTFMMRDRLRAVGPQAQSIDSACVKSRRIAVTTLQPARDKHDGQLNSDAVRAKKRVRLVGNLHARFTTKFSLD